MALVPFFLFISLVGWLIGRAVCHYEDANNRTTMRDSWFAFTSYIFGIFHAICSLAGLIQGTFDHRTGDVLYLCIQPWTSGFIGYGNFAAETIFCALVLLALFLAVGLPILGCTWVYERWGQRPWFMLVAIVLGSLLSGAAFQACMGSDCQTDECEDCEDSAALPEVPELPQTQVYDYTNDAVRYRAEWSIIIAPYQISAIKPSEQRRLTNMQIANEITNRLAVMDMEEIIKMDRDKLNRTVPYEVEKAMASAGLPVQILHLAVHDITFMDINPMHHIEP